MSDVVNAGRLAELEGVIESGLRTFVEVGTALAEVRDAKLYRNTHDTFEAYCADKWNLTDRHARNLMSAARVAGEIEKTGTTVPVSSERQARELAKVEPEARADVWQKAVADTGGKPTAAAVREAASESRKPAPKPGKYDPPYESPDVAAERQRNARTHASIEAILAHLRRMSEDGIHVDIQAVLALIQSAIPSGENA